MIDHTHKCIFIHIQRTGGTFIEQHIFKNSMEGKQKAKEKHLIASQAKKIYKEYWNDYFKFSFVRDPWARFVSMLKFIDQFNVILDKDTKKINIDGYIKKYGNDIIVEQDLKYSNRDEVFDLNKHKKEQVYLNIFDEELDFIGKTENLEKDIEFIKNKLNLTYKSQVPIKKMNINYDDYFTDEVKCQIQNMYKNDIKTFDYKYGDGALLTKY
jgi:hypothetical protein